MRKCVIILIQMFIYHVTTRTNATARTLNSVCSALSLYTYYHGIIVQINIDLHLVLERPLY